MKNNITIIYPCDYFNKKEIDEEFKIEADLLKKAGFDFVLFDFDDFKLTTQNNNENSKYLYRGWMLTKNQYCAFNEKMNNQLLISTNAYIKNHHVDSWLNELKHFCSKTNFIKETNINHIVDFYENNFNGETLFIKDFSKSLKNSVGPIISNKNELEFCLKEMVKYRGFIDEGIVFKEIIKFKECTEKRFFVSYGNIFGNNINDDELNLINNIAEIIKERALVTVDIGYDLLTNSYKLIEIGDGQVSDFNGDKNTIGLADDMFINAIVKLNKEVNKTQSLRIKK